MTDYDKTTRSRSYLLPIEDSEFLLRDEMRGIRFALEYSKADLSLRDWGVRSTIIVFGSARTPSREQAEAELAAAQLCDPKRRTDAVQRAKRRLHQSRYYEEARNFGRIASERGGALFVDGAPRDNVIATGGGPGVMEAANRGAADAGAPSIGFNIALPAEQKPNPYSTPTLTFQFHYFAMRKMHFAMRANALVVFPGGFGTMDELFEILDSGTNAQIAWRACGAVRPLLLGSRRQFRGTGGGGDGRFQGSRPLRIRRYGRRSLGGLGPPRPQGPFSRYLKPAHR